MEDPYDARLIEVAGPAGPTLAIRGRGTCDMKANVIAGAFAAAFLDRERLTEGTFVFTADVQEETDSPVGVPALLERGSAEFMSRAVPRLRKHESARSVQVPAGRARPRAEPAPRFG